MSLLDLKDKQAVESWVNERSHARLITSLVEELGRIRTDQAQGAAERMAESGEGATLVFDLPIAHWRMLLCVRHACDRRGHREVLQGVLLERKGDHIVSVASDGNMLAKHEYVISPEDNVPPDGFRALIPEPFLSLFDLAARSSSHGRLKLYRFDRGVCRVDGRIGVDDVTWRFNSLDAPSDFPSYARIIPIIEEEHRGVSLFCCDLALLTRAAAVLRDAQGIGASAVIATPTAAHWAIAIREGRTFIMVMPMRGTTSGHKDASDNPRWEP